MMNMKLLQKIMEIVVQKFLDKRLSQSANCGGGIAFKLSNKVNLAIEDRVTITNDDLVDGQQWGEQPGIPGQCCA